MTRFTLRSAAHTALAAMERRRGVSPVDRAGLVAQYLGYVNGEHAEYDAAVLVCRSARRVDPRGRWYWHVAWNGSLQHLGILTADGWAGTARRAHTEAARALDEMQTFACLAARAE